MSYSYISHLECPQCGEHYSADAVRQLCTCGSPLLVRYDLERLKREWSKEDLSSRNPDLWRYHELLPVVEEGYVVTLGEGMTPLLALPRLGEDYSISTLLMKDESLVPSGSFKARGAAVGVSKAKELGVTGLAMPTNGNAGAAWALYSARAGIEATIVMPQDAPKITRSEVALAGAKLYLVNGLISDAGAIVAREVADKGLYDASTLKEPYRIEGKKTMGLEIAEQLGWEMPDVISFHRRRSRINRHLQSAAGAAGAWLGARPAAAAGCRAGRRLCADREGVGREGRAFAVLAGFRHRRLRHQCAEGAGRLPGAEGRL